MFTTVNESAIPFSFKSEPFHVPVSAQMWVNLGRILVHKCRECLFFPFWYNDCTKSGTVSVHHCSILGYLFFCSTSGTGNVPKQTQKWYILCPGKVQPKPGTIRGSFCAQKWYIICLKKWAAFPAARRFSILF